MQTYYCYSTDNHIIGAVCAINGDEAWILTRLVQPGAAYLLPALPSAGSW